LALLPHRRDDRRRVGEDDVRLQGDQLLRKGLHLIHARGRKSEVQVDIATLRPAEPAKLLPERRKIGLHFRIVLA
jgi:hypothetical protein